MGHLFPIPPLRAQGTNQKRRWKEYKRQRGWRTRKYGTLSQPDKAHMNPLRLKHHAHGPTGPHQALWVLWLPVECFMGFPSLGLSRPVSFTFSRALFLQFVCLPCPTLMLALSYFILALVTLGNLFISYWEAERVWIQMGEDVGRTWEGWREEKTIKAGYIMWEKFAFN